MLLFITASKKQNGNALFLILIAVALFAALSYAVTQSGRGGGSIEREQAMLHAAQIMSVAGTLYSGMQRFSLTGVPLREISTGAPETACFAGQGTDNDSDFANFCTSGSTCLFAPEGGGLTPPSLPRDAFDPNITSIAGWGITHMFNGPNTFNGINFNGAQPGCDDAPDMRVSGVGTTAYDDMIEVYPLKEQVCAAINRNLGIDTIPTHVNSSIISGIMAGREEGCVRWSGTGPDFYYYYNVVIVN